MDSSKFQINKSLLREEFYSDLNKPKRNWFFENFNSETRQKIQEKYYEFLSQNKTLVMFFEWLEDYSDQYIAKNPFQNSKNPNRQFLDRIEQKLIELGKGVKESSLPYQPNQPSDKRILENNQKEESSQTTPKFGFEMFEKNQKEESLKIPPKLEKPFEETKLNTYQNHEFRENPKVHEKPCFQRRVQNVSKMKNKTLTIRKKCFKRFLYRNDKSKNFFHQKFQRKRFFHKDNFFLKNFKKRMKNLSKRNPLEINTLTKTQNISQNS